PSEDLFAHAGRVGAAMRLHDWSRSPLGYPETWRQSLKALVGLMLPSPVPMLVAWDARLACLYNDAFATLLGLDRATTLVRRVSETGSAPRPGIGPLIEAAVGGRSMFLEDVPIVPPRLGRHEQAWFTFSSSPIRDEQGAVAGVLCTASETTARL